MCLPMYDLYTGNNEDIYIVSRSSALDKVGFFVLHHCHVKAAKKRRDLPRIAPLDRVRSRYGQTFRNNPQTFQTRLLSPRNSLP